MAPFHGGWFGRYYPRKPFTDHFLFVRAVEYGQSGT